MRILAPDRQSAGHALVSAERDVSRAGDPDDDKVSTGNAGKGSIRDVRKSGSEGGNKCANAIAITEGRRTCFEIGKPFLALVRIGRFRPAAASGRVRRPAMSETRPV